MRTTTAAAGVLLTAVLSLGFAGTANAADVYNCSNFTYQEDAQAVYDQDTSDPNGLDDDDDNEACDTLPRRGSAAAPTGSTGTTSGSNGGTGSQVSTRPVGAVAAGDGSASEDGSALPFVLGGAALAAAGGAAVAARRSARTSA